MPTLEIKNRKVNYIELNKGASESLVMVHGMFTNLSVFYFNIGPALAERYHVVMYDLRSHGMSEWTDTGYDVKTMAADLIDLMNALGIEKAHLFGYSFGGLISMHTAIHQPDRVLGLTVLESPDPGRAKYLDGFMSAEGQLYLDQSIDEYAEATNLRPNKRQIAKSKKLYEHLFNNEAVRQELLSDIDFMTREPLETIKQPTLLLYADRSDCLEMGRELHRRIPHSTLKIGSGDHNIPVQDPKWIIGVLSHTIMSDERHNSLACRAK
jgi:Predicted hydrolases or acyltransferases (alpha/beta hydrolase superfamily)